MYVDKQHILKTWGKSVLKKYKYKPYKAKLSGFTIIFSYMWNLGLAKNCEMFLSFYEVMA